jgi:hypothetical protein
MIGSRGLQLGCFGLVLGVKAAHADPALYLSTMHLEAESPAVIVTHDHDVKRVKMPQGAPDDAITLDLNSTLRIVRKSDKTEIFKQEVMPLTALTSVDGGRYFAGLSNLKTIAHEYNFILISADGRIVTTALITPMSHHCRTLSATTTNFIRWFDDKAPKVQLSFEGGEVDKVFVENPYDNDTGGRPGKCVIQVAAGAKSTGKP